LKKPFFACMLLLFALNLPAQEGETTDPAVLLGITEKPFAVFNYGLASTWLTRIITQSSRNNFVFSEYLPGLYCAMKTVNMEPLNSMVRVAAYYPLMASFNGFPQTPKSYFHFAADLFAGIDIELSMWRLFRFNLSPGLHFYYQKSDRWHYIHLGGGILGGLELPVARRWKVFLDGIITFDNANFGTNKDMEPYDIAYQYQIGVGFRYSKKLENEFPYIK